MRRKNLSKKRKVQIRHAIEKALLAMNDDMDEPETALRALDMAMKLFNERERYTPGEMRYDELDDACDAFLREVELPTLAVVVNYIQHWRREEQFAKLGRAAFQAECDMTHHWRCEAWQIQGTDGHNKRRSSDPDPKDPSCDCGLLEISEAMGKIVVDDET